MTMSDEERARRRRGVERAFDDLRLDGRHPTPAARADAEDYIQGRKSLDELIERVVKRHTRV